MNEDLCNEIDVMLACTCSIGQDSVVCQTTCFHFPLYLQRRNWKKEQYFHERPTHPYPLPHFPIPIQTFPILFQSKNLIPCCSYLPSPPPPPSYTYTIHTHILILYTYLAPHLSPRNKRIRALFPKLPQSSMTSSPLPTHPSPSCPIPTIP